MFTAKNLGGQRPCRGIDCPASVCYIFVYGLAFLSTILYHIHGIGIPAFRPLPGPYQGDEFGCGRPYTDSPQSSLQRIVNLNHKRQCMALVVGAWIRLIHKYNITDIVR